jgi:hypothetical protein
METLYDRRDQLCLEFAKACVKKFSDIFPKNTKTHAMETRYPESPIIYMQHLLNEDQQKV